jgi:hypothetical protein
MSTQNSGDLSPAVPLIVALVLVREAGGAAQTMAAVIATIATTVLVPIAAGIVWTPLLRKPGFWWSSLVLGFAIAAVGLAAAAAGVELGGLRGMGRLSLSAAMMGLIFSWGLAAIRGAQHKKQPLQSSDPTIIRSRLLRGRRRALQ